MSSSSRVPVAIVVSSVKPVAAVLLAMKPAPPSSSSRAAAARDAAAAASESVAVKQSHGQRQDPQVREREPGRATTSPAAATSHRRRLCLNHRQIRRCRSFWRRLYRRWSLPLLRSLLLLGIKNKRRAPVNYVSLHCVKPILRALSMAISTVSIHIFGDVPSSPLVGILQVTPHFS
ncbi:hypothetical protein Ahy_B08g090432 [Arachis hypogaea]|uniref:Uncharacterized protein n=1 Tax=Arachis hypogaea TaxID=3818 RepID=A0A444Y052_ARAHY|nr:hypothetical protein Ahy_B08g090432 [Arachis hypogaea]